MTMSSSSPSGPNEQLSRFAATGELIELEQPPRSAQNDRNTLVLVVIGASLANGAGLTLVLIGGATGVVLGLGIGAVSTSLLLPALQLLRSYTAALGLSIRPGAVLPPDLIRVGHWIFRDGAWVRVDEVNRNTDGVVVVLLSSHDIVELASPTTVAAEAFRPPSTDISSATS